MSLSTAPVKTPLKMRLHADERAIYLPAISEGWARMVYEGKPFPGLNITAADLNFLDPTNRLFRYPYALYSAGQHNTAVAIKDDIVSQRDRDETIVLGDSGGFQVQTTAGYFTPERVLNNMRWMEAVSDYSMVLDFPTGGIASGNMAPHVARLTDEGWDLQALNDANRLGIDYNACLVQTKLNNNAFQKNHAPGATKFLNVLQGRSEAESRHWYEAVKHYPFTGWAFAGHHQNRFSLILARLIDMREDGLLGQVEWLHVLGISTLEIGVLLTATLRAVRRYNPTFQISFDTASPFLLAANQRLLAGATFDKEGWSTQAVAPSSYGANRNGDKLGDLLVEEMEGKGTSRHRIVSRTALSRLLTLGNLRKPDNDMSNDGYMMATHHNIEALADAHDVAHQRMFDDPIIRDPLATPLSIKTIAVMIDQILDMPADEARSKIVEWKPYLDALRKNV